MTRVVYGINVAKETLRAGRAVEAVYVSRRPSGRLRELLDLARAAGASVREVDRDELDRLAGSDRHQGIVLRVGEDAEAADPGSVGAILDRARRAGEDPFVLLLDEVQDPQNFGALLRSAHAFGVHGVVTPERRSAPLSPVAIKASAGAAAHLPVARIGNLKRAIEELKAAGVWCAAAVLDGTPLDQARLTGPLAVVVGGEGKGVRRTVAEACDFGVTIPMARDFDSLNASVAGAIVLYEVRRQRARGRA